MNLETYRDVHPSWQQIENLTEDEARSVVRLIFAGTFVDGDVAEPELEVLADTWRKFPFVHGPVATDLVDQLRRTQRLLVELSDEPERFQEFLDHIVDAITDDETRIAVMRLLAIVLSANELTELQQEYFYAVGHHFDYDNATIEDLLRAAWESYQATLTETAGKERKIPLVKGRGWADSETLTTTANPFRTQPESRPR